jgi:hypothetical protein
MIVDSFLAYQIILVVCSNGQGLDYEARLQGKRTLSRAYRYKQEEKAAATPYRTQKVAQRYERESIQHLASAAVAHICCRGREPAPRNRS